ncbi:MAG: S49 family peptidase [Patescibacteria group bacterium]
MVRSVVQDISRLFALALIALTAFWAGLWIWGNWNHEWSGFNAQFVASDGYCNIAVMPIVGDITTLPHPNDPLADPTDVVADQYPTAIVDDILFKLHVAETDPHIEGILVRIDSLGGTPVASEILTDALKASPLPVVALIREFGTSGGYLTATGADTIFASPLSDVGAIGVTMSYLENVGKNTKEGLRYIQLSSATFKDYGDPNKVLTAAERALFERDLKIHHAGFVKRVAENRKMPVEDVAKLADGSSMPGILALEHGLIDALGNQDSTRAWFANKLGVSPAEIKFCE